MADAQLCIDHQLHELYDQNALTCVARADSFHIVILSSPNRFRIRFFVPKPIIWGRL